MIDDDVEPIDELLRELGSAAVTPPPWLSLIHI